MSEHTLNFALNGQAQTATVPAGRLLIHLLRDDLGLTGTKEGCSVGVCGACSVLVNGQLQTACLLPAVFVDGASVITIEGLAPDSDHLTELQQAFIRDGGFQCGICTPGQIIAATALLNENPRPTQEQVKWWMMGNLCRCTGYYQIVESIMDAAERMAGSQPEAGGLMASFDYHAPTSLDEALDLLARYEDDAHLIAGGTSVVLLLNQGLISPGHLVSLRGLPGLSGVQATANGGLRIGALTTHRQAETAAATRAYQAALAETFAHVATIRIRNQATVGGNLVHADPAQDPPPMLMVLDGQATVQGKGGVRSIPLDQFFVDYFETAVQPGEILTGVDLPPLPPGTRSTYVKFLPRTADDYATVSVAARLRLDGDGKAREVRVALGAAGTTPLRAKGVEGALEGQVLTPERIKEAAAGVTEEVDPLDDIRGSAGYKREMARVWTERALLRLLSPAD